MNQDIQEMINIYKTFNIDWMGEKINNLSDLTRHHITKKQYNGEDSISNYALLTTTSHHLIHYLEINYNKEYKLINELLLELNRSRKEPSNEHYSKMKEILKIVKKDIKNKKRKRR